MDYAYYDNYINKKTKGKYDTTPLFENSKVRKNLIRDLAQPYQNQRVDLVAGLEALGFSYGASVAHELDKGFVHIRKQGKLTGKPPSVLQEQFTDYSGEQKGLEINRNAIKEGDLVLIVDDWIETGAQARTAISLIKQLGGVVQGISVLAAQRTHKNNDLFENYQIHAIGTFDERTS